MPKTLFCTETGSNSITAFSSPGWQAGWWNNMLWFSENYFQINLREARDSPFSTSIQSSGLDCCWQQLPRWSFCSCQIILQPVNLCVCLCPQFPDSRQVLLSAGAKLEVKIFSLLWCLFIICAVNVSSQFTLAGGEWHLASHLNTKVNYWTHLATIQFQLLKGQKSICTSLGELHHCKEFLWGYLTVNSNALRHPGRGAVARMILQSSYIFENWESDNRNLIICQRRLSIIQAKSCLSSWSSRFEADRDA